MTRYEILRNIKRIDFGNDQRDEDEPDCSCPLDNPTNDRCKADDSEGVCKSQTCDKTTWGPSGEFVKNEIKKCEYKKPQDCNLRCDVPDSSWTVDSPCPPQAYDCSNKDCHAAKRVPGRKALTDFFPCIDE